MRFKLLKLTLITTVTYWAYRYLKFGITSPIVHGVSSSAKHDSVDAAEEASMDSFPASDPPAQNIFK